MGVEARSRLWRLNACILRRYRRIKSSLRDVWAQSLAVID